MNCPNCNSLSKKNGKDRNGNQRFKCLACGKRFAEPKEKNLGNMILAEEKALMCLNLLVEGNSIRSTERITGVHRDTVLTLLEIVGKKCMAIEEKYIRDVKVDDVQIDEIWGFIEMKEKTKKKKAVDSEQVGHAYTFTAIESNSKLIVAWHLGRRTSADAIIFLEKLNDRVSEDTVFQMSSDAYPAYADAVASTLGNRTDYGQVIKIYGNPNPDEVRYSAGNVTSIIKKIIIGNPLAENISTSYVERQNLTMRMSMRRLTRLTNAFSKKWDNLNYALALHFAYYNFCRIHSTIKCTPAMEAGITKTVWSLKDLLKFNGE